MTETVYVHPAPPPASWWELYLTLADHGHRHPGLQPVEIHPANPDLAYQYPSLVASLAVQARDDRCDATALAEWVDSLNAVYLLYTQPALGRLGDTIITVVGVIGEATVALWTVIRGSATIPTGTDRAADDHVPLTVAALRAYDHVRTGDIGPPTDFLSVSDVVNQAAAGVPAEPADPGT